MSFIVLRHTYNTPQIDIISAAPKARLHQHSINEWSFFVDGNPNFLFLNTPTHPFLQVPSIVYIWKRWLIKVGGVRKKKNIFLERIFWLPTSLWLMGMCCQQACLWMWGVSRKKWWKVGHFCVLGVFFMWNLNFEYRSKRYENILCITASVFFVDDLILKLIL